MIWPKTAWRFSSCVSQKPAGGPVLECSSIMPSKPPMPMVYQRQQSSDSGISAIIEPRKKAGNPTTRQPPIVAVLLMLPTY